MDTETETILWMYCDLGHPAPLQDLKMLRHPEGAHPSTRESLRLNGLAESGEDDTWRLTQAGRELLQRAETILAGGWIPPPAVLFFPQDHRFRRGAGKPWALRAAHLKALRTLAQMPGRSWRSLQSEFGRHALLDLLKRGLAVGEPRRGLPWYVADRGLEVLHALQSR